MALDLSVLADYSWSDIKKAAKVGMINGALGGSTLTINGRTVGRFSPDQMQKLYDYASDQEQAEQAGFAGSGNVLVTLIGDQ